MQFLRPHPKMTKSESEVRPWYINVMYSLSSVKGADMNVNEILTMYFLGSSSLHPCLHPLNAIEYASEWLIPKRDEMFYFQVFSRNIVSVDMTALTTV